MNREPTLKPGRDTRHSARHPLRDVERLARIVQILVKYGWHHYVDRLGLRTHLPAGGSGQTTVEGDEAERLRGTIEELGTTFIKFGQMLSLRQDLLSAPIVRELEKLQDAVPPFPSAQARAIATETLGRDIDAVFDRFDDAPLAAASIAQVHAARLPSGTEVVVKVQRPGIRETISADLSIMRVLARALQHTVPESRHFEPVELVEEFADMIGRELDFVREGQNAERFRALFADAALLYVPAIFWDLSGSRVLTMERSPGRHLATDYPAESAGRRALAGNLMRFFLRQVFETGFFHGDPHPGNLFLMPDGRVCFHDFGIVGRLSGAQRGYLSQLLLAIVARDAEWMAETWLQMGIAPPTVDRAGFVADLDRALDEYYAASRRYGFGQIMQEFIRLGGRHNVRMPHEFALLAKAFMTIESVTRMLDPEFDMIAAFRQYYPQILLRESLPFGGEQGFLIGAARPLQALRSIAWLLPMTLADTLQRLRRGQFALRLKHEQLETLEQHIDRASNRLSFSLIIASVVIGSSLVMAFHTGPHYRGIPLLGLLGYVFAAVLGLGWALAILRSGRL